MYYIVQVNLQLTLILTNLVDLEVNDWINPQVALREFKLLTIGVYKHVLLQNMDKRRVQKNYFHEQCILRKIIFISCIEIVFTSQYSKMFLYV